MDRDTSESDESEREYFADNFSHCSDESDVDDYFRLYGGYESEEEYEDDQHGLPPTAEGHDEDGEWSAVDDPPVLEEFSGQPGINPAYIPRSVAEAVTLFMDDGFFSYMVEESNRYYYQNLEGLRIHEPPAEWDDISIREMKKFLGLIILMAVLQKERENLWLWRRDPYPSIFRRTMSKDRFHQIWKVWHFNDNEEVRAGADKLCKIRPMLDYFVARFKEIYKPTQNLCLDDGVLPWKKKLFIKVHYAGELISYGILVRMVRESSTGYVCNLEMYCGDEMGPQETIEPVLSPFTGVWHHLYTNYHFNSVELSEKLLDKQIRICGILKKKGEVPASLKRTALNRRESIFRRKGNVLLQVWQSSERVLLISSIHSAEMKPSRRFLKPNALIDYRRNRKVPDRTTRYLYYNAVTFRKSKWTKWVALYLINRALFNAYVVYKATNPVDIKYHVFLKEVALHWASGRD